MLVVTDGYIEAEKECFRLIRDNLGTNNVFAFGIGSSVNRYLIEGLAKAGQGEPFIVTDPTDAPSVAEKFRRMVSQPVLTDIKVQYEGFQPYDVEPLTVPDLFADRPVVVFGKWRGQSQGKITLNGRVGGGEELREVFNLADAAGGLENVPLRTLWARQRLMRISDHYLGLDHENSEEIATLGLKYNLLTSETSFVAVHEVVRNTGGVAADVKQALPLPKGVSNMAVGSRRTPEPELWLLLIGVLGTLVLFFGRRARLNHLFGSARELQ